jgi:hypothetical protein
MDKEKYTVLQKRLFNEFISFYYEFSEALENKNYNKSNSMHEELTAKIERLKMAGIPVIINDENILIG